MRVGAGFRVGVWMGARIRWPVLVLLLGGARVEACFRVDDGLGQG